MPFNPALREKHRLYAQAYDIDERALEVSGIGPQKPGPFTLQPPVAVKKSFFGGRKNREEVAAYEQARLAYDHARQEHERQSRLADYFEHAQTQFERSLTGVSNPPPRKSPIPSVNGYRVATPFVDWNAASAGSPKTGRMAGQENQAAAWQEALTKTFNETMTYLAEESARPDANPAKLDALRKVAEKMTACMESYAQNEQQLYYAMAWENVPIPPGPSQQPSQADMTRVSREAAQTSIDNRRASRDLLFAEAQKLRAFVICAQTGDLTPSDRDQAYLQSLGIEPAALTAADVIPPERDPRLKPYREAIARAGSPERVRRADEDTLASLTERYREPPADSGLTAEHMELLEREIREASQNAKQALESELEYLKAVPAGDAEQRAFYMNVGAALSPLDGRARGTLLAEDRDAFLEELYGDDGAMQALLPGFKAQSFYRTSGDEALEARIAAPLDHLAVRSNLHPGVMEQLSVLDGEKRLDILMKITGPRWNEAVGAVDELLSGSAELDGVRLFLKESVLQGRLLLSQAPDARMDIPDPEAASMIVGKSHEASIATRAMKNGLAAYRAKLDPADPRAALLDEYAVMPDREMLASLLSGRDAADETLNGLVDSGKFMYIRALACHISMENGAEATADDLKKEPCLSGYDENLLAEILSVGGVDSEDDRDSVLGTIQSRSEAYDHESFGNRFWNFLGGHIGREMSAEAMAMRAVRSVIDRSYDARQMEIAALRDITGAESMGSVYTTGNLLTRGIMNLSQSAHGDWSDQLARAGGAAVARAGIAAGQPMTFLDQINDERSRAGTIGEDGATLAVSVLAIDYLATQALALGSPPDAERCRELSAQMKIVMDEMPTHYSLLGMTSGTSGEDDSVTQLLRQRLKEDGRAAGTFADDLWTSERFVGHMQNIRDLYDYYGLKGRAVAALNAKDTNKNIDDKIIGAFGNGLFGRSRGRSNADGALSDVADHLRTQYGESLGADIVVGGTVESHLNSGVKKRFEDVTCAAVMRLFQENAATEDFGAFCQALGDENNPLRDQLRTRLADSLAGVEKTGDPAKTERVFTETHTRALSGWMIDSFLERAGDDPAQWLRDESQRHISAEEWQVWQMRQISTEASGALKSFFKEETVGMITAGMDPGMSLVLENYARRGASFEIEADLSLEVKTGNDVTIEKHSPDAYSVYLGRNMMLKLGIGVDIDFWGDAGNLEMGASVEGSYAGGVKLDFDSEAKCTSFLQQMFGVVEYIDKEEQVERETRDGDIQTFTRQTREAVRRDLGEKATDMFQLASNAQIIRTYGLSVELEAEVNVGWDTYLNSLSENVLTVEDESGGKLLSTEAEHELADARLAANLQLAGKVETRQTGMNGRSVITGVTAAGSIEASVALGGQKAEQSAEGRFNAYLERRYVGDVLVGASLVREYEIEGGADGAKRAHDILDSFGVRNDALEQDIRARDGAYTVTCRADLTPEGLDSYQKSLSEDNSFDAMCGLTDRRNYRMNGIEMSAAEAESKTSFGAAVELEVSVESVELSVGAKFFKGATGKLTESSEYIPVPKGAAKPPVPERQAPRQVMKEPEWAQTAQASTKEPPAEREAQAVNQANAQALPSSTAEPTKTEHMREAVDFRSFCDTENTYLRTRVPAAQIPNLGKGKE